MHILNALYSRCFYIRCETLHLTITMMTFFNNFAFLPGAKQRREILFSDLKHNNTSTRGYSDLSSRQSLHKTMNNNHTTVCAISSGITYAFSIYFFRLIVFIRSLFAFFVYTDSFVVAVGVSVTLSPATYNDRN